jgi:TM2 domain-containing membrane protein YozV
MPVPSHPNPGSAAAVAMLGQKSAGVAAILSLLFTGACQMYCGRVGRGIAFFCAAVFCALLLFVLIGFVLLPIVYIWALIDAVNLANRHNENLARQILAGPYS